MVTPGMFVSAGGRLVLDGRMSAGALVSFMLYQQSLSSAFQVDGMLSCVMPAALPAQAVA